MKRPAPYFPLLLAVYPVLTLYASNTDQFTFSATLRPLAVGLAGVLLCTAALSLALRNWHKGALVVGLLGVLVLVHRPIGETLGLDAHAVAVWIVLGVSGAVWLVGSILLARTRRDLAKIVTMANLIAAFLVAMPVVRLAYGAVRSSGGTASFEDTHQAMSQPVTDAGELPNVYHIILDGYARSDVLWALYGVDNSAFLEQLRARGFYVADSGRSNYCQTTLSLTSMYNLNYIRPDARLHDATSRAPLMKNLRDNRTFAIFRSRGYRVVAFASGYYATEFEKADQYVSATGELGEFSGGLLRTLLLQPCGPDDAAQIDANEPSSPNKQLPGSRSAQQHRDRVNFTFDNLPKTCELPGPVYVFAHIVSPHPPFLFRADGRFDTMPGPFSFSDGNHLRRDVWQYGTPGQRDAYYRRRYAEQLAYVTGRVLEAIDAILANSEIPPVIILQSDHGPGLRLNWEDPAETDMVERLSVLMACRLPDGERALYPTITPVNVMRTVVNRVLGTDYPRLEDLSFFSIWKFPYRFIAVDNIIDRDEAAMHAAIGITADR